MTEKVKKYQLSFICTSNHAREGKTTKELRNNTATEDTEQG